MYDHNLTYDPNLPFTTLSPIPPPLSPNNLNDTYVCLSPNNLIVNPPPELTPLHKTYLYDDLT